MTSPSLPSQTKHRPKRGAAVLRKLERFTSLELNGVSAHIEHGVWHSSSPELAARLNVLSGLIEYSASDPHPDATIARGVAARLGARLVQVGAAPKRLENALY
jgi:hypothetical protein